MKDSDGLHTSFRLHGNSYSQPKFIDHANHLIKNGALWEKEIASFLLAWVDDQDFVSVHTSGSTGIPKRIELSKETMRASAILTGQVFNLPEHTKALLVLPASYIAGKMMLVRAMVLGWDLYWVEPKVRALDKVDAPYDFCAMTPVQVINSLEKLNLIQTLIIGGGAIPSNLLTELTDPGKYTTQIFETYGMTETATHVAIRALGEEEFVAIPGVEFEIDDRECLVIRASHVTDIMVTNDIVQLGSNQSFSLLGRLDDVINSGGVKIHPAQLEKTLSRKLNRNFFISSLPHAQLGEQVVLVVEGNDAFDHTILEMLPKIKRPSQIIYRDSFERTHTGKVDKKATLGF